MARASDGPAARTEAAEAAASVGLADGDDTVADVVDDSSSRRRARVEQVAPYKKRARARKNAIPPQVVREAERSHQSTPIPPFGERRFATFAEFAVEWAEYTTTHFIKTRTRQSALRNAHNAKLVAKYNADLQKPRRLAFPLKEPDLLPAHMTHSFMTLDCTHGCYQESRGPKKRKQTRYRHCEATITARAVKTPDGTWYVQTNNENYIHSHECSPVMFHTVQNVSELVVAHNLLPVVQLLVAAKTPTRRICDIVSRAIKRVFTAQHLANFKRDKLHLNEPLANLRVLLQRFNTFDGSDVLLVKDEQGKVCALGLQSPAQREYFRRYGDNLVMDLTYNTNNYRFNFGALMVTSPTGCGVSVFDFLCINQTKEMLSKLLLHFVSVNEGAALKPKSIVIDKDLAEWKVLEEVFPRARIILCKFHVTRRFDTVIDDADYGVPVPMREQVRRICSDMIHARTSDAMDTGVDELEGLLAGTAPQFIAYFHRNWSGIVDMWSDFARGNVFSALNGTTNRIESSWGEFKKRLGSDRTIDHWFETLCAYSTAVFNRELDLIIKRVYHLVTDPSVDPFLLDLLRVVSDYVATALKDERHLSTSTKYNIDDAGDVFYVRRAEKGAQRYRVRRDGLTCTCNFAVSSGMPCRHAFVVAEKELKLETFPLEALADRWRLDLAADMIPSLKRWIGELQTVRLVNITNCDDSAAANDERELRAAERRPANIAVAYIKLRKGEKAPKELIVLDDLEKRSRVRRQLDPLAQYLMVQPMPKYTRLKAELDEALSSLLAKWTLEDSAPGDVPPPDVLTDRVLTAHDGDNLTSIHDAIDDDDVYHWAENGSTVGLPVADHDEWARGVVFGCATPAVPVSSSRPAPEVHSGVAGFQPDAQTQRVWFESVLLERDTGGRVSVSLERDAGGGESVSLERDAQPGDVERDAQPGDVERDAQRGAGGEDPDTRTQRLWFESMLVTEDSFDYNSLDEHGDWFEDTHHTESYVEDEGNVSASSALPPTAQEPEPEPDCSANRESADGVTPDCESAELPSMTPSCEAIGVDSPRAVPSSSVDRASDSEVSSDEDQRTPTGSAEPSSDEDAFSGMEFATRPQPRTRSQRTSRRSSRRIAVTRLRRPVEELLCIYSSTKPISLVADYMGRVRLSATAVELAAAEFTISSQPRDDNRAAIYDLIDADLVHRMGLAVQLAGRGEVVVIEGDDDDDDDVVRELVFHFGLGLPTITAEEHQLFAQYYRIQDKIRSFNSDMDWLQTVSEWGQQHAIELMRVRTGGASPVQVASQVATMMRMCALDTELAITTNVASVVLSVQFGDIIGHVLDSRSEINDAVLMFSLRVLTKDFGNVHVFDTAALAITTPPGKILEWPRLVFPIFYARHWCVICVTVSREAGLEAQLYNPLGVGFMTLHRMWRTKIEPTLRLWWQSSGLPDYPDPILCEQGLPTQRDAVSCGVFCFAKVIDFVYGGDWMRGWSTIPHDTLCQLRLWMVWHILFDSDHKEDLTARTEATKFQAAFELRRNGS